MFLEFMMSVIPSLPFSAMLFVNVLFFMSVSIINIFEYIFANSIAKLFVI